jgi:outer membrane lipopolysaccharide assembly protein LptE/RlpB
MKQMLRLGTYFIVMMMLAGCKSCGYSLSGINIPADVKTISVQFFPNKATLVNPVLSQKFTEQLKDKFLKETSLTLIKENGDFRLSGEITGYRIEPAAVTANTGTAKNKLTMTVKAIFECPTHKDLNFTEEITKFTQFDASENFQSIETTLSEDLSRQIIQEIFNKVALKW